ncbi:Ecto-ADP-ribosyltransferase 5-like Protein [Tribolium castaneum]|uniref:NAD(P)(+)--arginine ADP-ribosyltransferase n=1 Tax=Tribolium castaneum TaxID=7070 RepID=D6WII4_TRICA|nr:Ecto-ADP-ribosyltransferase 5-like Protein [Tribolium castaneum]
MPPQRQNSNQRTQLRYVGTQAPFIDTQDFQIASFALKVNINDIRRYLAQELAANRTFRAVWEASREIHAEDVEDGRYDTNTLSEFYIAIIAYSFEYQGVQIYVDFNAKSRQMKNLSSWNAFPYKSLYCLLAQSVKYVRSVPDARATRIKLYRGLNFVFPCQVNQKISFGQFASFSTSEGVARRFMGNSGTLFEIQPPVQPKTTVGIEPYSFIDDEEEVLVMAWSQFVVKRIIREQNKVILESVDNKAVKV